MFSRGRQRLVHLRQLPPFPAFEIEYVLPAATAPTEPLHFQHLFQTSNLF